ncbi:MAG: DUF3786 domain-containing protein [Desulfobacterales bacterium]|jgi:hypothetical protein
MPRIDDYMNAKKLAVKTLSQETFGTILARSGYDSPTANTLRVPFLNRAYQIRYPEFEFEDMVNTGKEIPIQEQVLILHYLTTEDMPPLSSDWVSYREIPGASFYFSAFAKRAIDPLKKVFGRNLSGFAQASGKLNSTKIEPGDAGFEFMVFPYVPLQLILWAGDDEFPEEANILFDRTIEKILSPEDVAWMAGMVVYRLIALSR